jgi:hypothetical protein
MPTPQKHDIGGFSVAWNFSIVCSVAWTGLLRAATGLGGVRVYAFYEDMIKEGISAIPERDTQAAGNLGDFSGQASIYSGVQGCVFVALQPDNAKVVRLLLILPTRSCQHPFS